MRPESIATALAAIWLFGLAGCATTTGREEEVRAQERTRIVSALNACSQTYPSAQRDGSNAVPFARCIIAARDSALLPPSIYTAEINAKRLELAEKLAAGHVTLAEYKAELASYALDVKARQQAVAASQRAEKAANCAAARAQTAEDDQSHADEGNSSGFAALAALIGGLGDGMAEHAACD